MKITRHVTIFIMMFLAVTVFMALAPRPKTFAIDTDASSAAWQWLAVPDHHSGTIYISSGELLVDNTKIKGGTVHVDLNSLSVSTVRDLRQNSLVTSWLKGKDFFNTYNHPTALLKIASVWHESGSAYTLNGWLTIKGKTQPVRVPAVITFQKKKIEITAQLTVDQSRFGTISHSSDSVSLRRKANDDEFRFRLHLVAKRR